MKNSITPTIAVLLLVGCNGQFVDRSLVEASEKGDLNKIQQLLDSGADPNVEDYLPIFDKIIQKLEGMEFKEAEGYI